MKNCSRCGEAKELDRFRPDNRFSSGRRPECRKCAQPGRAAERKRYKQTPKGRKVAREGWTKNYWSHREEAKLAAKLLRVRYKLECLSFYSNGEPVCNCCGEVHIEFLSMDHLEGGGRKHRDEVCGGQGGTDFYRWLRKNDYPPGFQVLCFNCNFAKHVYGVCPHVK